MRRVLAALALLVPGALHAAPGDAGSRASGPAWRELRTAHFVLSTDLAAEDAATLAALLETALGAAQAVVPGAPAELTGRLPVVAFSRFADFRELAPAGSLAYFMARPGGEAAIVLAGDLDRDLRHASVGHEITHYVLARTYQWQPSWVSEGLARNMEDVLDPSAAARGPGPQEPRPDLLRDARRPYRAGAAEVLAERRPERMAPGRYTTSWLLVRYLLAQHREALGSFMRRLDGGEEPAAAWKAEFPAWDPAVASSAARLDEALAAYARDGARYERPRPTRDGAPPAAGVVPRALSSGEVHAARIRLASQAETAQARARLEVEIAEALAEDPAHVAALWVRSGPDRTVELATARSAAARHPGEGRAWLLLARASAGDEREGALRRAAELSAEDAAALEVLAEERRRDRRLEEAWSAARRAAELAPWSPAVAATLADVALEAAPCGDAIAAASRALVLLPAGPAAARFRAQARRRLEGAWARCAPLLVGPHGERRPGAASPASRTPP